MTARQKYYNDLREAIRLPIREIAIHIERADSSVRGALGLTDTQFYSSETMDKIFQFIQEKAAAMRDALNRLSNGEVNS